jgi:hypothetical protein
MITCAICAAQNHHLAVVCVSCGGYLQNRAENLDLFATCWEVVERPMRAFRGIALSRRKNFSSIVASLAGVAFVFAAFWAIAAAEYASSTFTLFAAGFVLGPVTGVVLLAALALLVKAMAATQGLSLSMRNAYAVYAYATVPLILTVLLLLPLEVVAFGRFLFTAQPSPYSLRPVMYLVLTGLDLLCALWTLALLVAGTRVLLDVAWSRAVATLMVPLLLLLAGITAGLRLLLHKGGA